MSAYVVSDKCINRVLAYMRDSEHRKWFAIKAADMGITEVASLGRIQTDERLGTLGDKMFALNVEAVGQRYPDCKSADDMPGEIGHTSFTYRYELCSKWQSLKSLDCLIYQCSEGDISERPLYRFLVIVRDALRDELIDGLPQYQAAQWG